MRRLFPILIILTFLLSGCGIIAEKAAQPEATETQPAFVFTSETFPLIEGSAALKPLAEAVASIMLGQTRDGAAAYLDFGNTAQSYQDLINGQCGLVLAAEPSGALLEQVSAECEIAGIACDALVFIVSESNPIENLTLEQIKKIFTGEYTNWSQLGGDDTEIRAVNREDWSASRAAMENLLMCGEDFDAPITEASENAFDGSDAAIAYSMYYYADIMQMYEGYKVISVEGVSPGGETIASGEYPLIFRYCAAISSSLEEESPERMLWEWLQGSDGQKFIASLGYVPA